MTTLVSENEPWNPLKRRMGGKVTRCIMPQKTMQKLILCVITHKEGALTSIKKQKSLVCVTFQYLQPLT